MRPPLPHVDKCSQCCPLDLYETGVAGAFVHLLCARSVGAPPVWAAFKEENTSWAFPLSLLSVWSYSGRPLS